MDKSPIDYEEYITWLDTFLREVCAEFVRQYLSYRRGPIE